MADRPVIIRADAGSKTGAGHVMRCLALAQALATRQCPSVFLVPPSPRWITERLAAEGFAVVSQTESPGGTDDAKRTASIVGERDARWVILDGYQFGAAFQGEVTATGVPTAVIDDNGELGSYEVDLVLNQNLHAREVLYERRRTDTRLLLGPRYTLLRREFAGQRQPPQLAGSGSRVLVFLGGGERGAAIDLVTNAIATIDDPALEVLVVGEAQSAADQRLSYVGAVDDMPERMRWADLAIASAGSVCWELVYMGLPAVTLTLADNQRAIARSLNEAGVSISLGSVSDASAADVAKAVMWLLSDPDRRMKMSVAGQRIVDGRGAARVADHLIGGT